MKIVIAEDDSNQSKSIKKMIQDRWPQCHVLIITTESEFYEKMDLFQTERPFLFVIDVVLPWARLTRASTPPPKANEDPFKAGVRCFEYLQMEAATKNIPVVLYSVLERVDLLPDPTLQISNATFVRKDPNATNFLNTVASFLAASGASELVDYQREKMHPNIGIVTALGMEYTAVKTMLTNPSEIPVSGKGAGRRYCKAKVSAFGGGMHNVVLSLASMGNNKAAIRASQMLEHFPSIQSIIMVGIAGGIPNPKKVEDHVRLGDICVSNEKGVVQYDFDKESKSFTEIRHSPVPPSARLLEAAKYLEANELSGERPWDELIMRGIRSLRWKRPPKKRDKLFDHDDQQVAHPVDPRRSGAKPRVFFGPIASANKLLKNPQKRDQLKDEFSTRAVEMEASGIADATWTYQKGYLVVRGICDYCDAHKNDEWQNYAAIVAAAYATVLIQSIALET